MDTHPNPTDLAAARDGAQDAFERLVAPSRSLLLAHCYSMLGSYHDAEDALQQATLRAWQSLRTYTGAGSMSAWLYRIATNVCLDQMMQTKRRALPVDLDELGGTPAEGVPWLEALPTRDLPAERAEVRESVELAFAAALQHLPPRQRAALLLRDVLGFSAKDAAEALDISVAAVTSALQHARVGVAGRISPTSQQTTLRKLGDRRLAELVDRYVDALERGATADIVALLTEDAHWSMPPSDAVYRGHAAITEFLDHGPSRLRWRHLVTECNAQPSVGCYLWDEDRRVYVATVVDVLTVREDGIAAVTSFSEPAPFVGLGLPATLPSTDDR